MSRVTAIGLMSGTSYDGVDVALIETDGEEIGRLGPTGYRPYSDQERDLLRRAIAVATNLGDRTERPKILAQVEELVTDMHAEAVEAFLAPTDGAERGREWWVSTARPCCTGPTAASRSSSAMAGARRPAGDSRGL
jgi:1,6-anhydro-N-acetylmuramate kinase